MQSFGILEIIIDNIRRNLKNMQFGKIAAAGYKYVSSIFPCILKLIIEIYLQYIYFGFIDDYLSKVNIDSQIETSTYFKIIDFLLN